ncbi:MAG: RDD family protein [Acidobacteriia bacterium]|nr:RDD family protein [Terriglobia bacterium]
MKGQFYCTRCAKFLTCAEELIGKRIECPLCGGTHDTIPVQLVPDPNPRAEQEGMAAPPSAVTPALPPPAPPRRHSVGGLITAGILLFAGFSTLSTPSPQGDSLRAILLGVLFLVWAFRQPLKWWQGFLTFFGGAFAVVGLTEALRSSNPTVMLGTLLLGAAIAAPLLYFGFRRPGINAAATATTLPRSAPTVAAEAMTGGNRLASFGERLLAWIIDVAIVATIGTAVSAVFQTLYPDWTYDLTRLPSQAGGEFFIVVLGIVIEILPTHHFGQSFGKRIMGLRVVPETAEGLSLLRSLGRFLLKYTLSMVLFLGGLWILFNRGRKSWHDMILRTRVVKLSGSGREVPTWSAFARGTVAKPPVAITVGAVFLFFAITSIAGWGSAGSKRIQRAESLNASGNRDGALKEYNRLIEAYPDFAKAYRMRGQLYIERFGNLDRAIRDHETAVALHHRDQEALRHLVQLYMAKSKLLESYAAGQVLTPERTEEPAPMQEASATPAVPASESTRQVPVTNPGADQTFSGITRVYVRPLNIASTERLDLRGVPAEVVTRDLNNKTKSTIMRVLSLDPNDDGLRNAVLSLDPTANLPAKRLCFVVTAASGDAGSFEVQTLSRFRDQYLMHDRWGTLLVREYYRLSPHAARPIASMGAARITVRLALQPIVVWAWLLLHPPILLGLATAGLIALVAPRLRTRRNTPLVNYEKEERK